MHAVILDSDISYPPTSGKRLRTLNLMVRLAQRHRVTYIGRGDTANAESRAVAAYLREHSIEPILVHAPLPCKSGLGFYGRLTANLFSSWPYSATSHRSADLRAVVRSYAATHRVDLWQCEWATYLESLDRTIPGPRLLMAHNVESLIWQRYYENARGWARRWYLKQQWRKFEKFEAWAFHEADAVVAVSPDDANLIRRRFGQDRVHVVENGMDRAFFEGVTGRRDPRRILFLGALDWRPNLDALELLLARIFPRVLALEPAARLVIVGRNPPPALAARLAAMPSVELHADVPDVRPFLGDCGVMTVPLRIGGGSRLKILEALACGLPVVSSRVGAEGLGLRAGEHYVAADEEDMAGALVETMRRPQAARALAQRGREVVLETYDWDTLAGKLETIWERCHREQSSRHTPCAMRANGTR